MERAACDGVSGFEIKPVYLSNPGDFHKGRCKKYGSTTVVPTCRMRQIKEAPIEIRSM